MRTNKFYIIYSFPLISYTFSFLIDQMPTRFDEHGFLRQEGKIVVPVVAAASSFKSINATEDGSAEDVCCCCCDATTKHLNSSPSMAATTNVPIVATTTAYSSTHTHAPAPTTAAAAAAAAAATHPTHYLRSPLWAAGFHFSESSALLRDVPYSPLLHHLFFGEEMSMAAR